MAAIKCDIKLLPWNRALSLTNNNHHSGIYSMSRNREREGNYKWVGPLVASENYFFRLKSRNDIKISDISSAKNYSIAAPRNDIYEKVLKDRGFKNLLQLSSKYQDVKLFLSGKIDLLIASPLTLPYQLAEQGANLNMVTQLIPLPVPELRGNYLALHPSTAEASVNKLQQALNELYRTGKVEQLVLRYKEILNDLP
jgi:polar amino acid transport system substrate-binding protein